MFFNKPVSPTFFLHVWQRFFFGVLLEARGEGEGEGEVAADEVEEAGREDNGVAVSSPAGGRKEEGGRKWVLSQC